LDIWASLLHGFILFNGKSNLGKKKRGVFMPNADKKIIRRTDIIEALALLTRLPLPDHAPRGAAAAWAYPLAGAIIGGLAMIIGWITIGLGVFLPFSAGLILVTLIVVSGGLHEDGLADSADGFWGGTTRERRLDIMKDSRIGSYGVIALVLSLCARWGVIAVMLASGITLWALIAVAALSRVPMVFAMITLPHARDRGLSASVGRPEMSAGWIALGIGAGISLIILGFGLTLSLLIAGALAALLMLVLMQLKVGGQTGDTLGATQQICELALLITLVSAAA